MKDRNTDTDSYTAQPEQPVRHDGILKRIAGILLSAVPGALKTAKWLLSIMIPVSLGVTLLKWSGLLALISSLLDPAFELIGLPGKSGLVFLTSMSLNIYSAIAVLSTLSFTAREATMLALMCLISHNFFVEATVQKKAGSPLLRMLALRLIASFAAGFLLNIFMPGETAAAVVTQSAAETAGLGAVLSQWALSTATLVVKVIVIVSGLVALQKLLQEFGVTRILSRLFAPLLRILGLPQETSFLWIVANVLGLAYGSAIMLSETESGRLSREHADLLNHHTAISHSLLEDTLLFVAIGIPAFWITIPRILLATVAVWERRFELALRKKAAARQGK